MPLIHAIAATSKIDLGTSVVVALARSAMTLAYAANDLQARARGRFTLGLGPQHASHLAHRFAMPSDRPVARMREFVAALSAIWSCWNHERPLDFRGEFYAHTLMTPYVSPPPNPFGPPRIFLAAVGPLMAELAGHVADGVIAPPFATPRHLAEVVLPAVERGLAAAGRPRGDFAVTCCPMVATGHDAHEQSRAVERARLQLAFLSSPADSRTVFDRHGLGHLGDEATDLASSTHPDKWRRMAALGR